MGSSSDDLAMRYARMALEDDEGEGDCFDAGDNSEKEVVSEKTWSLVGRFATNRHINFYAMKSMMASIWMLVMEIWVKELGPNRFLFEFYHERDM